MGPKKRERGALDVLREHVENLDPILHIVTIDETRFDRLIGELPDDRDRRILEWNMARGYVHFGTKSPMEIPGTSPVSLSAAIGNWLDQDLDDRFLIIKDAHLALRDDPNAVSRLKALASAIADPERDASLATVFLVSSQRCAAPELDHFVTIVELPPPDEEERTGIVQHESDRLSRAGDRIFGEGGRNGAFQEGVIDRIISESRGLGEYRIRKLVRQALRDSDLGRLLAEEKKQMVEKSEILEAAPATTDMRDIGGLEHLKLWLERKARVMARLPEAEAEGVDRPKGMMIVGMPGCGKSLTAKAAAALFGVPLLRLDVGRLMGKYVGESEENMRRALRLAEEASPCVLWVDEVEKAFSETAGDSASGGAPVGRRMFGHFLTWMQENTDPVFVAATANNVRVLPPEFLRRGRFDGIFWVGLPEKRDRAEILGVHLRKRGKRLDRNDVERLAESTEGFSGADIEAVINDAAEEAFLSGKKFDADILSAVVGQNGNNAERNKKNLGEYRAAIEDMGILSASVPKQEGKIEKMIDNLPSASSLLNTGILPPAFGVAAAAMAAVKSTMDRK